MFKLTLIKYQSFNAISLTSNLGLRLTRVHVCIAYNAVVMWPIQTADYNIQIFQSPYLYVYSRSCGSSLHAFSMKTPTISNLEYTSRRFTGYSVQTHFTFDLPSSKLWRDCRQIRELSSINLGCAFNRQFTRQSALLIKRECNYAAYQTFISFIIVWLHSGLSNLSSR